MSLAPLAVERCQRSGTGGLEGLLLVGLGFVTGWHGLGGVPFGLGDVDGCPAQAGGGLVGGDLYLGALVAIVVLPVLLFEAALDRDPVALAECAGRALCHGAPCDPRTES